MSALTALKNNIICSTRVHTRYIIIMLKRKALIRLCKLASVFPVCTYHKIPFLRRQIIDFVIFLFFINKNNNPQILIKFNIYLTLCLSELQTRRGNRYNLWIIFPNPHKNICCDPSLEPSHRDGSNKWSQHMV